MSNLNTNSHSLQRDIFVKLLAGLVAIPIILGVVGTLDTLFPAYPHKESNIPYGMPTFMRENPVRGNAYFIDGNATESVTPPRNIQAPTTEFPYGNLEGSRVSILIEPNSNVWSEFKDSIVGLNPVDAETLTYNLTRKLEEQEGRKLDLVYAGEEYTLDLKWEMNRYVTPLPGEYPSQGNFVACKVVEIPTMTEYHTC